jgi:hypothetical protein
MRETLQRMPGMGTLMREQLQRLAQLLREEQRKLLVAAAASGALPSQSTLQRVATLELNIAAIENTLTENHP